MQRNKQFSLISRHDCTKLAGGTARVVHEVSVGLAADGDTRGHAGLLHGAKHFSYGLSRRDTFDSYTKGFFSTLWYYTSLILTNPNEVMEQDFLTTPTVFLSRYPTPIAALQSDKVLSVIKIAMSAVFLSANPSRPSDYKKSLKIFSRG